MESELLAGRYELIAQVGEGATGRVWRGFDTLLRRSVAIKIVDLAAATDPAMAERFRREGVAIAGVSDDAIVKVWDTGTDDKRGWLVMELLSGPNTSKLVKEGGPLSYQVALPMLADVADGLQAAHDAGITHRDVKPANIVLDAQPDTDGTLPDLMAHPELGRPVLVDFGIARIVDEAGKQLTRPATAIGTAAYMSPEQARGMDVGSASDIYSLACVAYHLILGRPPFVADSSIAVAHAQAFDTPVPLLELSPDIPPALDTLITRMLAKDATVRPSAREVAHELRAISVNPQMAPTVPLDPGATQMMEPTAETQLIPGGRRAVTPLAETRMMTSGKDLASSPDESAPIPDTDSIAGEQAGDALEPSGDDSGSGGRKSGITKHWGRWLVGLVILLLIAALVYSWTRTNAEPQSSPTVTLTSTATAAPSTTAPAPTTSYPTTQAPPVTTYEPPPTYAPPTVTVPPTTIQPTITSSTGPSGSTTTTTTSPPTETTEEATEGT
ncbi:serine/threonine-protein kinase [Propionimicrobium sp. PCR01-08-3]|uniref:serine/threonine-protein kinase n=1 Tax=Propionimicrobium sp. PCR01-08-3 TaxID=3052086 RepID=UPI00255D15B3|nr:serine/threonine-protein kinase [Propionimicrobium sp. PCR01-08-3]WIY82753.1 serine/threonine-protein kinase [Propionimicrobium sp. PCR01-08-3]